MLLAPAALPAQGVVPPGLSYVTDGHGAVESTAARWDVAPGRLRILYVSFGDPPQGRPDFWLPAWNALEVWGAVPGIRLRFEPTPADGSPDVEFGFVDRFRTSQAGVTHRQLVGDRLIEHVTVTLARMHSNGVEMSDAFLGMVALHEVGHVVGLPHSEAPGDAMHPGNRNFTLSKRDLRSVRDLYRVEP